MNRIDRLEQWLAGQLPDQPLALRPASADASFRRYFRVGGSGAAPSRIVMDAPPEHEDCRPWLKVAALFREAGVHVPEVIAQDLEQGFILMSDLGDTTYLEALRPDNAAHLYADALGSLLAIQKISRPDVLPDYSREKLLNELRLFDEWYVSRHCAFRLDEAQRAMLATLYERIIEVNLSEPHVFVHRDYHSRNLMRMDGRANPGIIDFQDAVYGPISYDLVSLFKDAYITWDEEFTLDLMIRYWEAARQLGLPVRADFANFHRDFEWMGVQRHLKVLGIFARLNHRDGKEGYLRDMPRVMEQLRRTCTRYREFKPLLKLLDQLDPQPASVGYTF
ncbi:aminoglycoside phosphotransferase family protein [Rhodocyclaceae bacterium SMB388]